MRAARLIGPAAALSAFYGVAMIAAAAPPLRDPEPAAVWHGSIAWQNGERETFERASLADCHAALIAADVRPDWKEIRYCQKESR